MHPSDRPAVDLENRLRLDAFLLAHGARLGTCTREAVDGRRRALTEWLIGGMRTYSRALGMLNWLAQSAERNLMSGSMTDGQLADPTLQALIGRFAAESICELRGACLRFPDEAARFYANGGWLEEHVHDLFRQLRREVPHIQDLARGVSILRETSRGDAVPNELDVACLADNRLYLVECKTRAWTKTGEPDPGASALYRLDTLADLLGGLQAKAMLVSYRDLPAHVLRRAADLGVRVCTGARLPELTGDLRGWLR